MAELLDIIQEAFAGRAMPETVVSSTQLSDSEHAEAMALAGKPWQALTCDLLEANADVVFWLSPEAFCYYLPGMLSAGIRENRPDLKINDSLIGMLDRSPEPAYWDDFFLARWPRLDARECAAVQEWVRWLARSSPPPVFENTYARAQETLELLKQGSAGNDNAV